MRGVRRDPVVQGREVKHVTEVPSPATFAARFGRQKPSLPRVARPVLCLPTGWDDLAERPEGEHFYLDTGIFHSLACAYKVTGPLLMPLLYGHEPNETILAEVRTQRSTTTLSKAVPRLLPALAKQSREPCALPVDMGQIESIRDELMADAQVRHPDKPTDPASRTEHGGEAELIHLAEEHTPPALIWCNDAGASAVARVHGVASIHFLHVLRSAVAQAIISTEDAFSAARDGFSESGLSNVERGRTETRVWIEGS